jgi:predicted permease
MRRIFRLPVTRTRIARDVDDELSFHLEMRVQRLIDAGWAPDAARAEALRQFGDVGSVRESMMSLDEQRERATRRADFIGDLRRDLVFAVRSLKRNSVVTITIVAVLSLGIGANTAIFSLVDAVFVRKLPVLRPDQLVAVGDQTFVTSSGQGTPHTDVFSEPLYRDIRDQNQVFSDVLATGPSRRIDVRIDNSVGELEHPRARYVSANYFSVLGVPPTAGRTFDARMDDVEGAAPVITISHAYWTRRFQRDPSAIGRGLLINGVKMTIVGVTPPPFTGDVVGVSPEVWLPLAMHDALEPRNRVLNRRSAIWLLAIGRLKPGVTLGRARKSLPSLIETSILRNAPPRVATAFRGEQHAYVVESGARGLSELRETFQAPLVTLMAGVALLLGIICANVANLLLARAIGRHGEMAVRLALGADRSRLLRQLMTESALLALLSAAAGLVVAWWGSRGLLALAADGTSIPLDLGLDLSVLAFTAVVSLLAVAVFGLAPALRASRVDLAETMRGEAGSIAGARSGRRGRFALGDLLVAGQVAVSLVLLIGAAMFVRSLGNVQSVDAGVDREHIVIAAVDINARGYDVDELASTTRLIRDRLAALPGVAAVTLSENGLFSGTDWSTTVQVPGFAARTSKDSVVATDQVGAGFAHAIDARLVAGRDLSASDEDRLPRRALVNQALASFYFPGRSAVGQFLHFDDTVAVEIVGVIADVRDRSLASEVRRRVYFPYLHRGDTASIGTPSSLHLIVRTSESAGAMLEPIRRAISSIDPQLPIDAINPLTRLMARTIREERLVARVASGFGLLALLFAAVGLYGVMTYAITRRTGEIGLRVALGAQRDDVARMVFGDAMRLVGVGLVTGVPIALVTTRLLRTQLHDVGAVDPASIGVAVGVLATSAVLAVALPALRAARVSPMEAMRAAGGR